MIELNKFTISPLECGPIVYSCEVTSGKRIDFCSFIDGSSKAIFDINTGKYELQADDIDSIPAGEYVITITGTASAKSESVVFSINIVDPCPSSNLTLKA